MHFLAHRGFWKTPEEQNTLASFEKAFSNGFGIEFDVRDHNGELVVAHDMPVGHEQLFLQDVLKGWLKYSTANTLAINIKADGLMQPIKKMLQQYSITNYFLFDMSVPETIRCHAAELIFFSRQSEYEPDPSLYNESAGVWLDCFKNIWYSEVLIQQHLVKNKKLAIVSPDLHKREYHSFWELLKRHNFQYNKSLFLCTDFPDEAREYFTHGK